MKDFSMVLNNGTNIDMSKICGCTNGTLDDCENNCIRYCDCYNVALANDILKEYENEIILKGQGELKMKSFKEFAQTITRDDVDLINKLDNMCDSEITGELADFISNSNELCFKIEKFVINHIAEYEEFIVSETEDLYEQELIEEYDYASGLYNCDEIYVRAILNALGIIWLPHRL